MGPRLFIVLFLLTLVSGCITAAPDGPAEDPDEAPAPANLWKPHRCDPERDAGVAHDLPWIDAWQGSPEELATRFAYALRETLPSFDDAKSEGRHWYWERDDLHIRFTFGDPDLDPHGNELSVFQPAKWPGGDETTGRKTIDDFLSRFGVPASVDLLVEVAPNGNTEIQQKFMGAAVGVHSSANVGDGSGRFGWWSGFHFRPLHDLGEARIEITEPTAAATARSYLDCIMKAEGKTPATGYRFLRSEDWGPDVETASLVHRVMLSYTEPDPPSHCGFARVVLVDARTGAVHGWEHAPCD